ncbi:MAG: helix-turn-helix domain-containing protein [Patescibacteria group bacterium]|nr:helix-turn-helix domain-containing protein [Patescibacteria group bacterium]
MKNKNFYSVTELARALNISRQSVLQKINKGQLKAEKVGRNYIIPKESLNGIVYDELTDKLKNEIEKGVARVVREYSEVLKKLGRE